MYRMKRTTLIISWECAIVGSLRKKHDRGYKAGRNEARKYCEKSKEEKKKRLYLSNLD